MEVSRHYTEWRPSDASWQFQRPRWTAIGELIVRQSKESMAIDQASKESNVRVFVWFGAWLAFLAFHGGMMALDWRLRDNSSHSQPMPGGLPGPLLTLFQWGSVILLGVAIYRAMPHSWTVWLRASLTFIQVVAAFAMMICCWLFYVLQNGIDTL